MSRARRVALGTVAAASLVLAGFAARFVDSRWVLASTLGWLRATGYAAITLLACAMLVSPVVSMFGESRGAVLRPFRRPLGIAAATVALLHLVVAVTSPWIVSLGELLERPSLRAGVAALLVLTAMLATSFPLVVRALGLKLWKPLHRAVYLLPWLVAWHLLASPMPAWSTAFAAIFVLFATLLARLVALTRARLSGSSR